MPQGLRPTWTLCPKDVKDVMYVCMYVCMYVSASAEDDFTESERYVTRGKRGDGEGETEIDRWIEEEDEEKKVEEEGDIGRFWVSFAGRAASRTCS